MDAVPGPVPAPRRGQPTARRKLDHDPETRFRPAQPLPSPALLAREAAFPPATAALTIRRYLVDKKNTKANKLLRDRYIKVKDPDDIEYYGNEFDNLVETTATIEKMETLVSGLESAKAARKIVLPPTPASPPPGQSPVVSTPKPVIPVPSSAPGLSVPVPSTGPAPKIKPQVTTFTLGPTGHVAKPAPVIDPYAGLSPKVRGLAVQIAAWKTNSMAGTAEALNPTEQAALQAWVESRQTASGKQKYVVNIGPGTGVHSNETQFKVSGFGNVGGKAPTFHITL